MYGSFKAGATRRYCMYGSFRGISGKIIPVPLNSLFCLEAFGYARCLHHILFRLETLGRVPMFIPPLRLEAFGTGFDAYTTLFWLETLRRAPMFIPLFGVYTTPFSPLACDALGCGLFEPSGAPDSSS